jgi:hypothetical protein
MGVEVERLLPGLIDFDATRDGDAMRKLGIGLVVAFALFYLITQPEGAATAVRGAADAVMVAFNSIIEFITALFR